MTGQVPRNTVGRALLGARAILVPLAHIFRTLPTRATGAGCTCSRAPGTPISRLARPKVARRGSAVSPRIRLNLAAAISYVVSNPCACGPCDTGIDRDVKIEHARIAHSERPGAGSTWSPCNIVGVGPAPIIIPAINAAALNAAESYPCEKSRRNSHGITSLQKN